MSDIAILRQLTLWQDESMKYQLVLQLAAHSMADFDQFVALKGELMDELGNVATVDGHDFGSGNSIFSF